MSDPLETNHLNLPYLAAAQAQKHVTHNEALRRLDTVVQLAVLDTSLTAPPGSPAEGDRYIVATGGTGDWSGKDGNVGTFVDGIWEFAEPDDGWLAFDLAGASILVFVGGAWGAASTGAIASVFGRTGAVVAAASDYDASQVDNDSGVSGATVKDALNTLNSGKAALASPIFTGTPAAPTASGGTNTTQIATTAFVTSAASGKAAAGANGDITALTAITGLNGGQLGGVRNRWTNGEFEIWQRGTASISCPAGGRTFLADRVYVNPAGAAVTQQQSTTVPSGAFSRYSLLVTGATSVTTCLIGQRFEAAAIPFVKRTITFQAKVYNGTGGAFTPNLLIGTPGAADDFTTVTNRLTQALQSCADAAWTKVSFPVDISGYANVDNGIQVELQIPSGSLNSGAKSVKIAEVDVSPGSAIGTFEACPVELLVPRCLRHLWVFRPGINPGAIGFGGADSATSMYFVVKFPVRMRAPPIVSCSSVTHFASAVVGAGTAWGVFSSLHTSTDATLIYPTGMTGASFTQGQACYAKAVSTSAYLMFDAEL